MINAKIFKFLKKKDLMTEEEIVLKCCRILRNEHLQLMFINIQYYFECLSPPPIFFRSIRTLSDY